MNPMATPTITDTLEDLLERVRKAEGPDRALDAALAVATTPTVMTHDDLRYALPTTRDDYCAVGTYWIKQRSGASLRTAPEFTASLDECLKLLMERLPRWSWQVGRFPKVRAQLAQPVMTEFGPGIGIRADQTGATIPLAMTAAILEALSNQEAMKEKTDAGR